ncbi:hypothetical protein VNO77_06734 [Canavalia gladiata]|uniref:Uncharacterized protein n=1 Tax=Canavalia gladiata TaxID=3824 RepID=A0AAN9QT25_CANGL
MYFTRSMSCRDFFLHDLLWPQLCYLISLIQTKELPFGPLCLDLLSDRHRWKEVRTTRKPLLPPPTVMETSLCVKVTVAKKLESRGNHVLCVEPDQAKVMNHGGGKLKRLY